MKPTDNVPHSPWPPGGLGFGGCPFCTGTLGVQLHAVFKRPTAIYHTEPPCKTFIEKSANDFLVGVLDIREAARRRSISD